MLLQVDFMNFSRVGGFAEAGDSGSDAESQQLSNLLSFTFSDRKIWRLTTGDFYLSLPSLSMGQ